MIDFKGLDKTQLRYVERDCPDMTILNKICIDKFIDTNLILNNVISDVIVEVGKVHPRLPFWLKNEDDVLLDKMQKAISYYEFEFCYDTQHAIYRILKSGKFNTKPHRAWLADVFGEKIHEEDFMENLQLTISNILYAILYV